MNYKNTYFNLYKNKYSSAPPQFKEQENYIMRFNTKLPYYAYNGNSLTIIYFDKGEGNLIINGNKTKVSSNKFITLNPVCDWEYINQSNDTIDVLSFVLSEELLTKFNFFAVSKQEQLLDTPFDSKSYNPFFFEQNYNANYYHSGSLLKHIYKLSNSNNHILLNADEIAFEVLQSTIKEQLLFNKKTTQIDAIKKTTKIETLKRLLIAYEYIHDNLYKNISIKELGLASGLSEFHLYNSFKEVFGKTPHQYMINQKMMRAKELLLNKTNTASEVSMILSFPDLPSFSKLFKKTFGMSPSKYLV